LAASGLTKTRFFPGELTASQMPDCGQLPDVMQEKDFEHLVFNITSDGTMYFIPGSPLKTWCILNHNTHKNATIIGFFLENSLWNITKQAFTDINILKVLSSRHLQGC